MFNNQTRPGPLPGHKGSLHSLVDIVKAEFPAKYQQYLSRIGHNYPQWPRMKVILGANDDYMIRTIRLAQKIAPKKLLVAADTSRRHRQSWISRQIWLIYIFNSRS